MKAIIEWFNKYGNMVIFVFVLFIFLQTCNNKTKLNNIKIVDDKIYSQTDSIQTNFDDSYIISKEELRLMLDIQKYQTAKQVLYDWNSVVRTIVRPDDRMNYYDNKIEELEKELSRLRANKILKVN